MSIIGPRESTSCEDYLAALDVTLTDAQVQRLDEVSAPSLGVPHEVSANIRDAVLGGDASRFDAPTIPVA